jgi:hypothetical protein
VTPLTPAQAAERLGIADEHVDTFICLVDALRTPEARAGDAARMRRELEAVDVALMDAGIAYPLGARGVRDLAALLRTAREDTEAAPRPAPTWTGENLGELLKAYAHGDIDRDTFARAAEQLAQQERDRAAGGKPQP